MATFATSTHAPTILRSHHPPELDAIVEKARNLAGRIRAHTRPAIAASDVARMLGAAPVPVDPAAAEVLAALEEFSARLEKAAAGAQFALKHGGER